MNEPTQTKTRRWSCCDGYGADVVYEADSAEEAAIMAVTENQYVSHSPVTVTAGTLTDDASDDPGDTEEITLYRIAGEWETA